MNEKFVRYADFGAVGDGVTNDFFAIKAAHEYANEHGLPVWAGHAGKTYLISETEKDGYAESIKIKTNTNFCGATFIIDDTDICWCEGANKRHNTHIFLIENDYPMVNVDKKYIDAINLAGGINADTKKIDVGLGYPAMLILYDDDKRVYIRYGGNENSGVSQQELVVIDENGNVDPETPLLFDYEKLTRIEAYRIDGEGITVENATFISKASQVNLIDQYHSIGRGIRITRPNTCVKNLEHKIINEIFKGELQNGVPFIGHSYGGFLSIGVTHNILVENVVFQARAYYLQGTYDLGAGMSNKLLFKNCTQSNFFGHDDPNRPKLPAFGKWWGVAGTNYCKNMVYDGCKLTRYDAHQGVVNGAIKNCEISSIRLIGAGDMLIENCKIYQNTISTIQLREDYGCHFKGTITVKDCEFIDCLNTQREVFMIMMSSNWNYGYETCFPNIIIDNVKIENAKPEISLLYDFEMKTNKYGFFYRSARDENLAVKGAIAADGKPNVNPYKPPEFIKVINNENNGYEITVPDVPFFKNTSLEGVKIVK